MKRFSLDLLRAVKKGCALELECVCVCVCVREGGERGGRGGGRRGGICCLR